MGEPKTIKITIQVTGELCFPCRFGLATWDETNRIWDIKKGQCALFMRPLQRNKQKMLIRCDECKEAEI